MTIFEFEDYKAFVRARIASMPRKGRGELQSMAAKLGMHSTRLSHIFKGDVHLTLEQGAQLAQHWALTQLESEYLILLIQKARAGNRELRRIIETQAQGLRERSTKIANRVSRDHVLSDSDKALFYSNWFYSGIRLLTSIKGHNTLDSISEYFHFPREKTREILDFLVRTGLCIEKDGLYSMGPKRTHLEASSLLIGRHHANWRAKALQRHEALSENELAYSVPVSIARKDQAKLRELILKTIVEFQAQVTASEPPEMLACLNIDWFEF